MQARAITRSRKPLTWCQIAAIVRRQQAEPGWISQPVLPSTARSASA
jgi:hypothetical protein